MEECASSEGLFYHQLLRFLGVNTKMRVHLDSGATRGVFQRQGAGRIRHLEIKSLWVQTALRERQFTLHAVGTHDNVADVGTKALAVQKLKKFRDELGVISEEEFRGTDELKTHAKQGVVGGVQLQNVLKVLIALGMMQPTKADGEMQLWSPEDKRSGWIFDVVFAINVMQIIAMMLWLTWKGISVARKWIKSQSREAEDDRSQWTRVQGRRPENQDLRRSGARMSAASSSSETTTTARPQGDDRTPSQRSEKSQYAYEKRAGKEICYDKCYPLEGSNPPKFYKSGAGECVHMSSQCYGLRNRKSPVQLLRVCAYCHDEQVHSAMSSTMREGREAHMRAGRSTDLAGENASGSEVVTS